jgi:hypothetical protein
MATQHDHESTDNSTGHQDDRLPKPPPLKRRFQIAPLQLIGIPLLALLPFLAMLGLFDEHVTRVEASNDVLTLQVEYPALNRYKVRGKMAAAVTLLSAQEPATITLAFDRKYLENFSNLSFAPSVTTLMPDAYEIRLVEMAEGETRLVELEMAGEHYWQHTGVVSAATEAGQTLSVTVKAFIVP